MLQADARFLTMYLEYVDGGNLADMNADGIFDGEEGCEAQIWHNIADPMEFVHKNGVVHNDIKPGNILWAGSRRGAVLCDFGLSTQTIGTSSNGGTIYYLPPEYRDHGHRGQPGDIWAFGVTILYVYGMVRIPEQGGAVVDGVVLT